MKNFLSELFQRASFEVLFLVLSFVDYRVIADQSITIQPVLITF